MSREWECEKCGYILVRETAPRRCPECEAANSFVLFFEDLDWDEEEDDEEE